MSAAAPATPPTNAANDESGAERGETLFSNGVAVSLDGDAGASGRDGDEHRCQIFHTAAFLFEERWLGCRGARAELVTGERDRTDEVMVKVRADLAAMSLHADIEALPDARGALSISNIRFEGQLAPEPVLNLLQDCLWIEPDHASRAQGPPARVYRTEGVGRLIATEFERMDVDQRQLIDLIKRLERASADASKAVATFRILLDTRKRLGRVMAEKRYYACVSCSLCDRIVAIHSMPEAMAAAARAPLEAHVAELTEKLAAATGASNKQRRKKLQRKIKALGEQLAQVALALPETRHGVADEEEEDDDEEAGGAGGRVGGGK